MGRISMVVSSAVSVKGCVVLYEEDRRSVCMSFQREVVVFWSEFRPKVSGA